MDPNTCLDEAEAAIDDGDLETARDRMRDYQSWRLSGGFEPVYFGHHDGGDARLRELMKKFVAAKEANAESSSLCWKCNGSGEGPADGTSCSECRGTGEEE